MYGAQCYQNLDHDVTHLLSSTVPTYLYQHHLHFQWGTEKTMGAQARKIFVLRPEWLYDSISQWKRLPEREYRLEEAMWSPPPVENEPFSEVVEKIDVHVDADILDALRHELDEELDGEDTDEDAVSITSYTADSKVSRPSSRLRQSFTPSDEGTQGNDAGEEEDGSVHSFQNSDSDDESIKPRKKRRRLSPKKKRRRSPSPLKQSVSALSGDESSTDSADFDELARQLMDEDWE
jgi:hypothetical protein